MHNITMPLFRTLFDQLTEPRIVLLPDTPVYTVVDVNTAYTTATGNTPEQMRGKSLWDFFKNDAAGSSSVEVLKQGLTDVLRHGVEMKLPIFRYGEPTETGSKPRWWQVEIFPVKDENGNIIYLTCSTYNVSLHVQDQAAILEAKQNEAAMLIQHKQIEKELTSTETSLQQSTTELAGLKRDNEEQVNYRTKELTDSQYRLNRIIANTPTGLCILKGIDLLIDVVNQPMVSILGRPAEQITGKPLLDVLPELAGQPFLKLAKQVMSTAKTVLMQQQGVIIIQPNGDRKNIFIDLSFDPLFDVNQSVEAVLVTANDVTELVNGKKLLQAKQDDLEALNEELTASNEELQAMNEEIRVTNEELAEANRLLAEKKN